MTGSSSLENYREMSDLNLALLTSLPHKDANHRIWFDALSRSDDMRLPVIHPDDLESFMHGALDKRHVIIYLCMYKDYRALSKAIAIRKSGQPLILGCIASDIYSLDHYSMSIAVASFFVAPTLEHKAILESITIRPVIHLEEPIDPISKYVSSPVIKSPRYFDGYLYWFGYPESFSKSMHYLMPVINRLVKQNYIAGICIISSQEFKRTPPHRFIHYSEATLVRMLTRAKYVICSHFSFDMHINSIIKTDNKAALALSMGAIPICSSTPSYKRLLCRAGLSELLYKGPACLESIAKNLDRSLTYDYELVDKLLSLRSPGMTIKKLSRKISQMQYRILSF